MDTTQYILSDDIMLTILLNTDIDKLHANCLNKNTNIGYNWRRYYKCISFPIHSIT